jgi:SOS-response transcriptional repressor LexA
MAIQKSNFSIGHAVRLIRKHRKMTLSDIADRIDGYDTGGLSRFERGEQGASEDKLRRIAAILEVPMAVLYAIAEYEENFDHIALERFLKSEAKSYSPNSIKIGNTVHTRVPLISWVQAGEWTEVGFVYDYEDDAQEWRETTAIVGSKAFALRVEGDSMTNPYGAPSIPEGSIVIIDPDKHADHGSIVVALLEDSNQATLKRLVIDGPMRYLKPLNPAYNAIEIKENCKITGVAVKVEIDL